MTSTGGSWAAPGAGVGAVALGAGVGVVVVPFCGGGGVGAGGAGWVCCAIAGAPKAIKAVTSTTCRKLRLGIESPPALNAKFVVAQR
jgi:hypothetical protein